MKKITLIITLLFMVQLSKAQDSCASPTAIPGPGTYTVGVINGTAPTLFCADNGAIQQAIPGGEWYIYTPTAAHTVTVSTDITANTPRTDTRVHVYTGTCDALTCFAGDDDAGADYSSVVTFNVTAGTSYIIVFDNRWLDAAHNNGFSFRLTEAPVVVPPTLPVTYNSTSLATINSTFNICVVDVDGDHKDDIVGVSNNNLRVHYQGAGGITTPTDYPVAGTHFMPNWSMAAGDYNRDGKMDFILGAGSGLSVWKSNGTSYTNITPGDYIFCQRTNFADLNDDGNLDIFSCHDIAPNCYYLNGGGTDNALTFYQSNVTPGAMKFGTIGGNYSTLFTDFDNDGDTDVFISKCSGPPCELHRNDGNGVYTDISAIAGINVTPIQTWSSAIGDFDNDGDMDVIITASSGTHKYFRNNLDTTNTTEEAFTNITAGSGWDTNTSTNIDNVTYDFDNDGFLDVLGGGNKIMYNQHNSTFAPVSYPGLMIGAIGDLNDDGFLDILNGSTIRYATPNTNKWIKVALQGVQSNRNGIGARIEIHGAWGIQIRDIRSGEGFEFMSSLNAHFGIGQATTIDQVIIRWPSGLVDTYNNVTPNQRLLVVEGATLAASAFTNGVFSVYPNPTKDVINIQLKDNLSVTLKSAAVYDLMGRVVLTTTDLDRPINVASLATGTYILSITDSNNKNYGQKFVKE
ncbi:FG-GAP-like repeat-containing protein [Flavobacterium wongokense]|uniref:FG-GAP-like repeat-containing protein n=1 Tax=Flavobacterium wongokense TaxID=2910674 RepID=UPI001F45203E|nr:FG-GAP-like repeat-containing protein [Flavobacterium sp. WG47]MCF6132884.1 FG-GAP-like repeat-containing protein [Flavobacterium sp. WG47]